MARADTGRWFDAFVTHQHLDHEQRVDRDSLADELFEASHSMQAKVARS